MTSEKPIHVIVLDAAPIIRGEPSISSLLQQCEEIVSTPEVIREIRDEATRSRLQTTLIPFLTLRSPNPHSVKVITDFARRTGDLAVLSKVDIHLLALSYEIECEKNGGDWRLRSIPGQKRTNGPSPAKVEAEAAASKDAMENAQDEASNADQSTPENVVSQGGPVGAVDTSSAENSISPDQLIEVDSTGADELPAEATENGSVANEPPVKTTVTANIPETTVQETSNLETSHSETILPETTISDKTASEAQATISIPDHATDSIKELSQQLGVTSITNNASDDSDSESGWITPSNLKKKQTEDTRNVNSANTAPAKMQVATITGDYAMQNVLLQMNLNLLSPTLNRIRNIKTFVLRCHACFNIVKDTSKQFCPRCGKDTLTRVSCTTDANGEFRLHLKKNMQWNHRGDRFSIPKPVAGASNGKVVGGGKNGWGNGLILAEDQKEFVRGNEEGRRLKQRDLMDEDYLPGLLTGDRRAGTGKMKVGAGRNVNSKKR